MEKLNQTKESFSIKKSCLLISVLSLLLCPFLYAQDQAEYFPGLEEKSPAPVKPLNPDLQPQVPVENRETEQHSKGAEVKPYQPPLRGKQIRGMDSFYRGTLHDPQNEDESIRILPVGDEEKEDDKDKRGGQETGRASDSKPRDEFVYRELERLKKKKQEAAETSLKLQNEEEEKSDDISEDKMQRKGFTNYEDILLPELEGEQQGQEDTENIDTDGDGIPDGEDDDIDGDGIPNEEDLDAPLDVVKVQPKPRDLQDTDGDGLADGSDPDIDGDGIPNEEDPDADGNGIPDQTGLNDIDGDGVPDWLDDDKDGDGVANSQDEDADGDGKKDKQ